MNSAFLRALGDEMARVRWRLPLTEPKDDTKTPDQDTDADVR
jgi:hypothetical protein